MARHEDIVNTIWDDLDHLSNDAFMLYVWSWTNVKCGMAGIYRISRRRLLEGRLETPALDAALAELEADDKLYYLDGVLWSKARVSHLSGFHKGRLSDVIVRSIVKDLRTIDRDNPLLMKFAARYGDHPSLEGHLTVYRPSPEGHQLGSTSGESDGLQTVQGQGQGQGQGIEDPVLRSVIAKLEQVAFAHSLSSPSVTAVADLCQQFAGVDLDAKVAKFAHYRTGPGAKREMPGRDVVWAFRIWLESEREPEPKVSRVTTPSRDRSRYDAMVEAAS